MNSDADFTAMQISQQCSLAGDVFLKLVVDVFLGSEYKKNIFRGITDSRGQERLSQMRLDKLKSTRSGSG